MRRRSKVPSHSQETSALASRQQDPSHPTAIPGVRIAHIGGKLGAVVNIRTYWQSRGATFMHYSFEEGQDQAALGAILARADIVFHSSHDTSPRTKHHLAIFCERACKPLIPLEDSSLSSLEEVLGTWCPIA